MGDPYAGKVLVAKVPKGSDNGLPVVIYRVFRIPKGYPWTAHDGYRRQEERSNQPVQRDAVIHDVVLHDEVLLDVLHGPGLALVTKTSCIQLMPVYSCSQADPAKYAQKLV